MAEAMGIAGSIIAVLQLSQTVVKYLIDIRDTSKDRQRLLVEVRSVTDLLYMLRGRAEFEILPMKNSLGAPEGPVKQFRQALEELVPKLMPATGLRKVGKTLSWPFKKEEIVAILERIERQKSLISLALQNDHIALSAAIRVDVASLSEGVEEIRMAQRDDAKDKVLRWLASTNPSSNHDAARKKHEPTTGAWLLRSQFFTEWKHKGNSLLWLHGIPGCGKTILCSSIVEDIAKVGTNGVAYYYFDFSDAAKQNVSSFLRSAIAQLCQGAAILPDDVRKLYDQFHSNSTDPGVEKLLETLISVIHNHGPCFFILDALDESERENVLEILSRIVSRGLSNLHMLVTSRKERHIEEVLAPIVTGTHSLSLDTTDVDADISLYVRQCLATDPKLRRWSDPVKAEIETSLTEGACGMFRWVECQIIALRSCRTETRLREALKQLPKTLDDTYDRILLNIPEEDRQMARSALLWLAFSERPLYLSEVAEAAILSPERCTVDPGDRLMDPHEIIDICSALVTSTLEERRLRHEESRKILRFAHFSVKEYIISDRIAKGNASAFAVLELEAQRFVAQVCISYLLLFNDHELASEEEVHANPLLVYAAEFWHVHACKVTLPATTMSQLQILFRPDQGASFLNWLQVYDPDHNYPLWIGRRLSSFAPPLYYASLLGIIEVASSLIDEGADVNTKCGKRETALAAAAYRGHATVVQLLLLHGADFTAVGSSYFATALGAAAWKGHDLVVQILMTKELGIEANRERIISALGLAALCGHEPIVRLIRAQETGRTLSGEDLYGALESASYVGHVSVVRTLLRSGASVDPGEGHQRFITPLQLLSHEDHVQTLYRLPMAHGVDISSASISFNNALEAAASTGQISVIRLLQDLGYDLSTMYNGALLRAARTGQRASVQFLLNQGADVNVRGGDYGSAIQAAALGNDESLVQVLLEAGADVNAESGKYGSALQAAAWSESYGRDNGPVVKMLLDAGADVNAEGGPYGTALQAAAAASSSNTRDNGPVVKMLLDAGADVNAESGKYGSALQAAAQSDARDDGSVVKMLLDAGADVNAQGGIYGSALQAAAASYASDSGRVVKLLLDGAHVNAQGGKYSGALQAAATSVAVDYRSVVKMLLDAGADVNAEGGKYGSALQATATSVAGDYQSVVKMLLGAGADVKAQGGKYGSALQAAAASPTYAGDSGPLVKLLIDAGADVNAQGRTYGSALQAAAASGSRSKDIGPVLKLLIDAEADVNAQGGKYGSALQAAAASYAKDSGRVVKLLLDAGADVNAQGGEYGSALQAAAASHSRSLVKMLLDAGADVNAQGGRYGCALAAVVDARCVQIAVLLLRAEAERHPMVQEALAILEQEAIDSIVL